MFKLEPMEKVNRKILDNLGLCGLEFTNNLDILIYYLLRLIIIIIRARL